jgi:hypothetical protein
VVPPSHSSVIFSPAVLGGSVVSGAHLIRLDANVGQCEDRDFLLLRGHEALERREARFVDGLVNADDRRQRRLKREHTLVGFALTGDPAFLDGHVRRCVNCGRPSGSVIAPRWVRSRRPPMSSRPDDPPDHQHRHRAGRRHHLMLTGGPGAMARAAHPAATADRTCQAPWYCHRLSGRHCGDPERPAA